MPEREQKQQQRAFDEFADQRRANRRHHHKKVDVEPTMEQLLHAVAGGFPTANKIRNRVQRVPRVLCAALRREIADQQRNTRNRRPNQFAVGTKLRQRTMRLRGARAVVALLVRMMMMRASMHARRLADQHSLSRRVPAQKNAAQRKAGRRKLTCHDHVIKRPVAQKSN